MTSLHSGPPAGGSALQLRLLGVLAVVRDGRPIELPPSRKARALLAWLAANPQPSTRSALCSLLWPDAEDPRAELRWCLSRLRVVLGTAGRLVARDDAVRLDVPAGAVDAAVVDDALAGGRPADLDEAHCRALLARFGGEFLQGFALDGCPAFDAWLTAQRNRFRRAHVELLERLASALPDADALPLFDQWRTLAPFDVKVHQQLLNVLARRGDVHAAEAHVRAAVRLFEDEGLDPAPLVAAARTAKAASAPLAIAPAGARAADAAPDAPTAARRASIAVMPFAEAGHAAAGGTGNALAHDVITRLAKLRTLFVIAQGTVFALQSRGLAPAEAARLLDVDYVVAGTVRRDVAHLAVDVELIDARAGRVAWADTLTQRAGDALQVFGELGDRLVGEIASEVEALERNRAVLKPPSSLDAWESLHRGLWHMYRFDKADNERARGFFERAVRLDPTFSRAYAGLSFTHFQDAFQGWAPRAAAVERAYAAAGHSLMADDRDPSAHWAMGRALWLRDRHDQCVTELEQAVDLSPNFALAHYTLAFVHAQAGDARAAVRASDRSRSLSPYDPLLFGMLGARAMALVRLGDFDAAARSAVQAAARPNAHLHIQAIAAFTLSLAGSMDEARACAAALRKVQPAYTVADFFDAFRFDAQGIAAFRRGAKRLGMD